MAKLIEYDVTGVEESQGGTGVKVKPGVHIAKIEICEQRETKSDGSPANDIRVAFNFGPDYDWGFTYIGLGEASDWKLAEFIRALKLKEKGKLDPEKQKGKFVRVKVNSGTFNDEYSPDMGKIFPPQPGDEKLWGEGQTGVSETSTRAIGPDEDEPVAGSAEDDGPPRWREGEPDPENPDDVVGSYDEWSDSDLEAEVTDRELTLPGGRSSKKNKMIAALRADDDEWRSGGGAAAPSDEPDAEPDDSGDDDYDSWDLEQLKTEWEERDLGDLPKVRGNNAEERLRQKLIEQIREDDKANPFDS